MPSTPWGGFDMGLPGAADDEEAGRDDRLRGVIGFVGQQSDREKPGEAGD
jgi:hypothetical protein